MINFKKYLINFLIVSYLSIIYFTGVPETNTFNERMKKTLQPIAFAIGVWPSWSMFAPNPIKFDSKTYVEYFFSDGTSELRDVEITATGLLAPFRQARWMKFSQDNLRNPRLKSLRTLAIRQLTDAYPDKNKIIDKIQLKRVWRDIKPFSETDALPALNDSYTDKENSEVLYTHTYRP